MWVRLHETPEVRLGLLGFLFNGAWEFAHSPLYTDWGREWTYLLWTRLHCTVGDVLILLSAFWGASLVCGSRSWLDDRRPVPLVVFGLIGFSYTAWSEAYNTSVRYAWSYGESMPLVFGLGVTPLAQWIVIPVLLVSLWRTLHVHGRGSA